MNSCQSIHLMSYYGKLGALNMPNIVHFLLCYGSNCHICYILVMYLVSFKSSE